MMKLKNFVWISTNKISTLIPTFQMSRYLLSYHHVKVSIFYTYLPRYLVPCSTSRPIIMYTWQTSPTRQFRDFHLHTHLGHSTANHTETFIKLCFCTQYTSTGSNQQYTTINTTNPSSYLLLDSNSLSVSSPYQSIPTIPPHSLPSPHHVKNVMTDPSSKSTTTSGLAPLQPPNLYYLSPTYNKWCALRCADIVALKNSHVYLGGLFSLSCPLLPSSRM